MNPTELYYQTAKDTVLYQSALHAEFTARAFNLLNIGVAVLIAAGLILNARVGDFEWTPLLVGLGIAFLVGFAGVSILCMWWGLRTQHWFAFPPPDALRDPFPNAPESQPGEAQRLAANYMTEAAHQNENVLATKAKAIFWAILALALEVVCLICAVILVFWG